MMIRGMVQRTRGHRVAVTFAAVALLCLLCPILVAQTWQIEVLDKGKQFSNMTDRSLRLDTQGHPHIAYGEDWLYYAWHDGVEWHYEVADASTAVGRDASLALDAAGLPHISYVKYYSPSQGDLRYAYRNAAGWHVEVVDIQSELYYTTATSVALDASGHPHISYCDYTNHDLMYARKDESGWHLETVDAEGPVGTHSSLTLDASGHPHISYFDGNNSALKYAYADVSGWHFEIVDSEGPVGWYTSIALDGSDLPHISYAKWIIVGSGCQTYSFPDDLKYAYKDGAGWHFETVDAEGYTAFCTSLTLDIAGYAHIGYCEYYGTVRYAHLDAEGWHIETLWGGNGLCGYTSLALDAFDRPHISCANTTVDDLEYAYKDASGWHIQTVDSGRDDVGEYASLALDDVDSPSVSYSANGVLRCLMRDDELALCQTVDESEDGCEDGSLAVDAAGHHHIGYVDATNGDLMYAFEDGTGWQVETAFPGGSVGYGVSLAIGSDGCPHMSCCTGYPMADLAYTYRDATGWHTLLVDYQGDTGLHSSLSLDGSGYPHIGFSEGYPNYTLKHAHCDAAGWQIETVDTLASGYCPVFSTSLTLDAMGYPHIGYSAWYDLKYAYQDESGWHIEVVAAQGPTYNASCTSLALDASGNTHLSWYDGADDDLLYAYRDAAGWQMQVVDGEGDVGWYCSLELDAMGRPHICYYDYTNKDLKYARMVSPRVVAGSTLLSAGPPLPIELATLSVWPNPARGVVHARLEGIAGQGMVRLTVVDLLGRRLMSLQPPETMGPEATMTLRLPESIPTGQYFLGVEGKGARQFVPITVVK